MKKISWQRILIFLAFAAVGAFLIVLGANNTKSPTENYKEALAVVSDVETKTEKDKDGLITEKLVPYIDYEVNGAAYTHVEYKKDGTFKKGDDITILYNPENPAQIATGEERASGGFIIALGVIVIFGGVFLLLNGMQSKKRKSKK